MRPLPEIEGDTARESVRGIAGGGRTDGGWQDVWWIHTLSLRSLPRNQFSRSSKTIEQILFTLSWASHEVSESGDEELCVRFRRERS